jgi:hypothetical protein
MLVVGALLYEVSTIKTAIDSADTSKESLKATVKNKCLELIKYYNIYKTEGFIEQANDVAKQYNSYILRYTELWEGNLPKDLVIQLPYIFNN